VEGRLNIEFIKIVNTAHYCECDLGGQCQPFGWGWWQ